MDVTDIMSFKPSQAPKRPAAQDLSTIIDDIADNPSDSYEARAKKR